ncbi:pimeloyl-ACP methyl ester esterase BioH [Vibrio pectenicida]|uniref:pimeloyl-ACP methyl ester esterase BioH n=1 Tax=Vibrio pectenicida TaxID=62763 RepID=UPI003B9AD43F
MENVVQNEIKQTTPYWQRVGQGNDLVLVHGWGMNGAVWQQTAEQLSQHFRVHIVDLPGFGHSNSLTFNTIEDLSQQILNGAPEKAIWLGWSLGGLIATHIALQYPQRITKLVTVASSPKFSENKQWKGIQPKVLNAFTEQLIDDIKLTIARFMSLQALGSPSARQDVKSLKHAVLSRPEPNSISLLSGLKLLATIDHRLDLKEVNTPTLRLYGRLDGLVPAQVAKDVDLLMPMSQSHVFHSSSHAPFITENEQFCQQVIRFAEVK